jgi:regulator of replication initiation timing
VFSQEVAALKVRYCVRAQAIEQHGKKYALIEVIDESESKNKWRINPAGKARALAGLLEKPLIGPPELGHEATETVGRPVDFTTNHGTRVLYEIPDPVVWERIRSGEWGPVSPQLTPLAAHYEGDTFVVDDWNWDHVAFVPVGAFPSAGVKSTCIGDPRLCGFQAGKPCGFSRALTAALSSQSRLEATRWPRTETDVGSSPREGGTQEARDKIGGHPQGGVIVKNTETEAASTVSAADAWDTADAPDEFFAVVPDEAKGPNGKKSLRKLSLASRQKRDLDPAIIRNALARFDQTDFAGTGVTKAEAIAKICRAAKKFDIQSPQCENVQGGFSKEVSCMECDHEKVIAELTDKNTKLETEVKDAKAKAAELTETNKKLDAELKDLKAKPAAPVVASDAVVAVQAELKAVKAEYEALKAWKLAQEDADHMRRVQDVVDRRIKAGLLDAKSVQAAVESLKKLPNDALDAMKADLDAVQGKFDSLPSGPKARLIPSVAARFDPMQPTVGDLVGKKPGEK